MKQIKITDVIEPPMLSDIAEQIENQKIGSGDNVDVLFDSCGGAVDVAFAIADLFEQMQSEGVNLRAVAAGKVYSSAIVPFLAIENRVAQEGSSFLVHKATYPVLEDQDKDELRMRVEELEAYTDELYDFYDDHGIAREVRKHLKEGDDLMLTDRQEIINAGFVPSFVAAAGNLYARLKRGFEQIFPASPQFSYVMNLKELNQNTNIMNSKQLLAKVSNLEKAIEKLTGVVSVVVNAIAETDDTEKGPTNEATALPETAMNGLCGNLYGTPVVIEDNEDVKFLGHFGQNMASGGTMMPLNADFKPVKLPDGDVSVKVGEEEFKMASNGGLLTMSPIPGNEVDPEDEPENAAEEPEKDKEPEKSPSNETPAPATKQSAAPQNRVGIPPASNTFAQKAAKLYERYPGAVARRK